MVAVAVASLVLALAASAVAEPTRTPLVRRALITGCTCLGQSASGSNEVSRTWTWIIICLFGD
jgi:hypothetical protein